MSISAFIVMMSCTCFRGTGVSVPKFLNAFFEMQERGGCFGTLNNDIIHADAAWVVDPISFVVLGNFIGGRADHVAVSSTHG